MRFSFFSPVKIVFGQNQAENLPRLVKSMGKKCFVVTGEDQSRFSFLFSGMQKAGITWETFAQKGEPSIDQVTGAAEKARQANVDVVLAIGGGSVLDAAKAVAALVTNRDDIMEYLEVIGRGNPLVQRPAPLIAVPTTSGTGAEVTCNAVLASPEHGVKVSMRSEMMYPDVALV
ncbi:MAG TPA: iron-containing alcohol dehydrogenase, partial [Desulfobacteraceae bacterium]|nr:iron-containing alcohol dehydrogenase [Desulfobacteraceae bacterium]